MTTHQIDTVFIGTSEEGLSSLEFLIDDKAFDVKAVITQPDKPVGRKRIMTPSPVKQIAVEHGISVFSPENNTKNYENILDEVSPELAIIIAFGEFLPDFFIEYPKYKCLNIHYSLLPQLRGAVPVQMAILKGLKQTGATIQIMESTMDTGPILAQKQVKVSERETTISLKQKLIPVGTELLKITLPEWCKQKITPQAQDHTKATYCYKKDISKTNAQIDWETMSGKQIERMVRAFLPWPVAWTTFQGGKRLKIFEAELVTNKQNKEAGELIIEGGSLLFSTSTPNKFLRVKQLQLEGKKKMSTQEFIQGLRLH